jgi:hypothetical protein
MSDPELTGLEWRVLLWVSLHDGMSLLKGNGAGCYASNLTLFAKVQCDYASGCRALSKLVKRGHLVREQLGRSTRYRVVFGAPDNLQAGNISPPEKVAGSQDEEPEYVAEQSQQADENSNELPSDYSSLSEELDSEESEELKSFETAENEFSAFRFGIDKSAKKAGKRGGEAGLGSKWSLAASLPRNFGRLPAGAQVARIEEAFDAIGRDPDRLDSRERETFATALFNFYEEQIDENPSVSQQALRLHEAMAVY